MTNTDRNTRTLIVSFAVAIMALIPLRFVEVGQIMTASDSQAQVLGEQTDITLPNADVVAVPEEKQAVLEAPYDQIDGPAAVLGASTDISASADCIVRDEATSVIDSLRLDLNRGGLSASDRVDLMNQIRMVEVNTCK